MFFRILLSLLFLAVLPAYAQITPDAGTYAGSISVTRAIPGLKITQSSVFTVKGILDSTGNFSFVLTNPDPALKMGGWSAIQFDYASLSSSCPGFTYGNGMSGFQIPGGDTIPKSLKITKTALSWKSRSEAHVIYQSSDTYTVSFSITRSGPLPPQLVQ